MSTLPTLSQKAKEALTAKGYDGEAVYKCNKLPQFATPRTSAYNWTTAFLVTSSLVGLAVTKKMNLMHHGFSAALIITLGLDFMQRRELDNPSQFSFKSSGSLEFELEKYPYFKEAFKRVNGELDTRICELEVEKAKLLSQ